MGRPAVLVRSEISQLARNIITIDEEWQRLTFPESHPLQGLTNGDILADHTGTPSTIIQRIPRSNWGQGAVLTILVTVISFGMSKYS